jgi:hypothetical protein
LKQVKYKMKLNIFESNRVLKKLQEYVKNVGINLKGSHRPNLGHFEHQNNYDSNKLEFTE